MINSIVWRKSSERVGAARQILDHPTTQSMLATMELDHPAKLASGAKDGFDATYRLGMIDGFERCLTMFRNLGAAPAPQPDAVLSTWGADVDQTNNK